jgi:hypothetical protein
VTSFLCLITSDVIGREIQCKYGDWSTILWPANECCHTESNDFSARFKADVHSFSGSPAKKSETKTLAIFQSPNVDFLPLDIVTEFPNLNGLSINFCNLPILKSGLFKPDFKGIEYLDLLANYVETIEPSAFQYLVKLKWLNLNKNEIQTLTTKLFKNNPDLTFINLKNNQISSVHPNFFDGLSKLNYILFGKRNFCVKDDVGCQTCEVAEAELNGKLRACFRGCKKGTDCYSSFFD